MKTMIGPHLTSSKGFMNIIKEATSINANTFQFFTRNPRGTKAKALDLKDIEQFKKEWRQRGNLPFVAHAPYTYNLSSSKEDLRDLALRLMDDDLKRLDIIGCPYYNFHPGSHTGQGFEIAIEEIASALNILLEKNTGSKVIILLETMAGKGTEVGRTFEQLKEIRAKVEHKDKIGILLDTCHIYDAGYDIKNNLDSVLDSFNSILGLENLKAIHLNDSLNQLSSHKDRHAKLGEGNIGIKAIENIVTHPLLKELPFLLETPNDLEGYKNEIKLVREFTQ
ncbi:MAG: deoxyribonuclease IV [Sphaerochaetaceae bacterium]|nr:deoxyribonuclease IV [Sphaerochaetaceae bacterium]